MGLLGQAWEPHFFCALKASKIRSVVNRKRRFPLRQELVELVRKAGSEGITQGYSGNSTELIVKAICELTNSVDMLRDQVTSLSR